jgi:3-methyladenine DNA glycosylase/8-oxoguanine DNA glycosylase
VCGHTARPTGHTRAAAGAVDTGSAAPAYAACSSLRDLACRTAAGEVPTLAAARRMEDAEIVEQLIAIHGIGRWSAEMFLMFHLGRPDVLPLDDYSLRKAYATAFRKRTPRHAGAREAGEKWRPIARWRAGICGRRRTGRNVAGR